MTNQYSAIKDHNAIVVAISVDNLSNAQAMARNSGVPFPILYNPEKDVVQAYGVLNPQDNNLARPSTFVIDSSGVIRWKYLGSTYDRPSPQQVLQALADISG